jgi:alcohol dehydrogenase
MKAAVYDQFQQPIKIAEVPLPEATATGAVIRVLAAGICRSDWHGWMGNDPDVKLPHVPGHEFSGVVEEVGSDVRKWKRGDRVTLPFVCGCGTCDQCVSGNHQVCDNQFQPGFTHWGAFAEYVAVEYVDTNMVRLPDTMDFVTAASLGCRFITAFRAIVDQGKVTSGQHVAVHGCGGVGLSAIMIAAAYGADVVAVDIDDDQLELARSVGASSLINSPSVGAIGEAVKELTDGGAHISIDALGDPETFLNSILSLRKRGKHIQIGIMEQGKHLSPVPIDKIIANELEIIGSHGMQSYRFPDIFAMIADGKLQPGRLIGNLISLEESPRRLAEMNTIPSRGIIVINRF